MTELKSLIVKESIGGIELMVGFFNGRYHSVVLKLGDRPQAVATALRALERAIRYDKNLSGFPVPRININKNSGKE